MMTLHPEFARRAQREIDSVLGTTRLPTLEDRDDLPYVDCIVQEVFRCIAYSARLFANILTIVHYRWNPPAPLGAHTFVAHVVKFLTRAAFSGVPHCSMEEDTYLGMTIPAKSMIIPNMW